MKKVVLMIAFTLSSTLSFGQTKSNEARLQLVRNATLIIDYAGKKILADPMFSKKGAIDSWAGIAKNPTVELKMPVEDIIKNIDLVVVTHTHEDHFDKPASSALSKSIELIMPPADKDFFVKEGFINATVLPDQKVWNGITITRVEGQHGTGAVLKQMGETSGFIFQAKNQPTLYLVGDTVLTDTVLNTIKKFNPDYIIVNCGGAMIRSFGNIPIILDEDQTMTLIGESGKAKVIAVHMDALDHCFTTRSILKNKAEVLQITEDKLIIPQDGEIIKL